MTSSISYNEELNNLQLDKPGKGKSSAQMQRHSIDPDLDRNPLEKWLVLLAKGDDLQKISVIENIPKLLQTSNAATVSKVIQKVQYELLNASCEVHIISSKVFKQLLEKRLPLNLLQSVLQGIDNKDPIISSTWLETLIISVPYLSAEVIKSQVLPVAVSKSQINKPLVFRAGSCKILGQVSAHPLISSYDVKKDILPLVQSLCQDCQFEVRATMCGQIPLVAKGLSNEAIIKSTLLPTLVELCADDNMAVRTAAVDVIVSICPFVSDETILATIIPLFKQMCNKSNDEGNTTYPAIAKNLGKLLITLQTLLNPADCIWFLQFYKGLSKRGFHRIVDLDPALGLICREFCASALPAMTGFTLNNVAIHIQVWYTVMQDLTSDPCYIIRKMVADSLIEIMKLLGAQCKMIKPEVVKLLRDDAEEVLEALVPNISGILMLFQSSGVMSRDVVNQTTLEIGRALLKCQIELFNSYNWRSQQIFMTQLECLPYCMPSDFIHQHFTSLAFNVALESRVRPVRSQATRTLLIFLKHNSKEQHRKWIRENLYNKFCCARSSYTRVIYIKMCLHALNIFSNRYFKEFFYTNLLQLADDPVSNIRLSVVNLTPVLKDILNRPIDRLLQTNLDNTISKLGAVETDKDVSAAIKCKLKEMRVISLPKQETLLEEKRRIEEEDKLFAGKPITDYKFAIATVDSEREGKGTSSGLSKIPENKFRFFTPTPEDVKISNVHSDSFILKNNASVSLCENLSKMSLVQIEMSSPNLTDDIKVNIRKITSDFLVTQTLPPELAKINVKSRVLKRYSSTNEILNKPDVKLLRRRSLDVISSDFSKIPVLHKNPSNATGKNKTDLIRREDLKFDCEKSFKPPTFQVKSKTVAKASNLPILIRRQADSKK